MSCNGCRVLRKGCSERCIIRPCLEWIESPQGQGNAVVFLSKFFGRSDLMSFISNVPASKRPALFQSLLFEACGRTINPVSGAVGLLSTGHWHICQAAVETILSGGRIQPLDGGMFAIPPPPQPMMVEHGVRYYYYNNNNNNTNKVFLHETNGVMAEIGESSRNTSHGSSGVSDGGCSKEPQLLNLFA